MKYIKKYSGEAVMILVFLLMMLIPSSSKSQIVRDKNGNFMAAPKKPPVKTPYIYTDPKGIVYPVYITDKGKYYVNMVSKKTGKPYKKILPTKNVM